MTRDNKAPKLKIGERIGADLTVLNAVDDRGREPVYIVWDHRHWCPMACKVFDSTRQAQREADILSALSHPYIVRCHGLVDARHLLMGFLEGPTLGHLIKTRPKRWLGISDALRVAMHIGAALCHVHDRGFLHMDVKPSNIVVVHGRPILCDFGIARPQSAPRPSHVHGTDPYIAPEECRCEPVTPAADVFGLAVTLYELLTGTLPFPEGTKKGATEEQFPQLVHPPVPVRRYRPAVLAGLDRLVLSCLVRDPAARPSLRMLIPALHDFIRTGPAMWPAGFRPTDDLPADDFSEREPRAVALAAASN